MIFSSFFLIWLVCPSGYDFCLPIQLYLYNVDVDTHTLYGYKYRDAPVRVKYGTFLEWTAV